MKPTIEKIRALCTESSFQRGTEYFHEGLVSDLERFGDKITAVVSGTSDYEVTINPDAENIQAYCTCPYDWGGYLKQMKDIKGFGKEFKEFVGSFRTKYANRSAFLDEMRRL